MTDQATLMDLYRRNVLQHSRQPHNFGRIDTADLQAEGHNPLCGDKLTVYLALDGENIRDITFEGVGCAISLASASMMTEAIRGKKLKEAKSATGDFLDLFKTADTPWDPDQLGDLAALGGVREYPSRIKCATLPWKTLSAAINRTEHTVSTE